MSRRDDAAAASAATAATTKAPVVGGEVGDLVMAATLWSGADGDDDGREGRDADRRRRAGGPR